MNTEEKKYDIALKSIIEKDITLLNTNSNKIFEEIKKINKLYIENDCIINTIDDALVKVDELIDVISNKMKKIKIGVFTTNKK